MEDLPSGWLRQPFRQIRCPRRQSKARRARTGLTRVASFEAEVTLKESASAGYPASVVRVRREVLDRLDFRKLSSARRGLVAARLRSSNRSALTLT